MTGQREKAEVTQGHVTEGQPYPAGKRNFGQVRNQKSTASSSLYPRPRSGLTESRLSKEFPLGVGEGTEQERTESSSV